MVCYVCLPSEQPREKLSLSALPQCCCLLDPLQMFLFMTEAKPEHTDKHMQAGRNAEDSQTECVNDTHAHRQTDKDK